MYPLVIQTQLLFILSTQTHNLSTIRTKTGIFSIQHHSRQVQLKSGTIHEYLPNDKHFQINTFSNNDCHELHVNVPKIIFTTI